MKTLYHLVYEDLTLTYLTPGSRALDRTTTDTLTYGEGPVECESVVTDEAYAKIAVWADR